MTAMPETALISNHVSSRYAIAASASFAVAVVLLAVTLNSLDRPTAAVVWGSIALAAYIAALLCLSAVVGHEDIGLTRWKIGPWTLLWFGVAFGLATVTWQGPQTGVPTEIGLSSVLRALWLVAVGLSAWMIGYCIGPGRLIQTLADQSVSNLQRRLATRVRGLAAPWILYAVGIAARLATVATTGKFGYIGDASSAVTSPHGYAGALGALSLFAPLAVAAAAIQVFLEGSRNARKTLIILFMVELAFGAAAGGKESFVIAVLAVVIPFSAARRRLPKTALIAFVLVFLIVVIPFNQAYRTVVNSSARRSTAGQTVHTAPAILRTAVTGKSALTVVPESVQYLAQRIREIDNVAIVLQRSPAQIPFISSIKLLEVPVAGLVPRALWRGKPVLTTGLTFSKEFYEDAATTASADTVFGGFYWYGGWLTVLVGMFLMGCGMKLLDGALDVRTNPHAIFLVLLLFPSLVGGEEDWNAILTSVPATICVWLVALFIVFARRQPSDRIRRPFPHSGLDIA